jgi:hypothetical protein
MFAPISQRWQLQYKYEVPLQMQLVHPKSGCPRQHSTGTAGHHPSKIEKVDILMPQYRAQFLGHFAFYCIKKSQVLMEI